MAYSLCLQQQTKSKSDQAQQRCVSIPISTARMQVCFCNSPVLSCGNPPCELSFNVVLSACLLTRFIALVSSVKLSLLDVR